MRSDPSFRLSQTEKLSTSGVLAVEPVLLHALLMAQDVGVRAGNDAIMMTGYKPSYI